MLTVSQLLIILSAGFLGFPPFAFWIALYFQTELGLNALMTGVHMLPMVVFGLLANLVAALVQHKVSNKKLMGIGAAAYVIAFLLAAVQRYGDSYWAFSFPALCICVIGADFQFIVANVSLFRATFGTCLTIVDVCPVINANESTIDRRLALPDSCASVHGGVVWYSYRRIQRC